MSGRVFCERIQWKGGLRKSEHIAAEDIQMGRELSALPIAGILFSVLQDDQTNPASLGIK